ncbi:MAG TPA: DUF2867 domain-containing protein [Thermomicrobiales bacterium]|nr:DUF2867 domain-containing protein [Thermomicrobiales bacterium]
MSRGDGQPDRACGNAYWLGLGEAGGYRGQMAVLVKPNGLFGRVYMAAMAPFPHLIVYPPLMRGIGQEWRDGMSQETSPAH